MFKKKDNEEMLSSYVYTKFNNSMSDKELLVNEWETYMKAYENENWENVTKPDYKSDVLTNYIFGTIETIRPIMLDNNPKFQVLPRVPEARANSLNLERALAYEYDREKVSTKLSSQLITMLVYGTAVFYVGWDSKNKEVLCEPINPLNIFPDPLATSVDDCEYIIYAKYMNVNTLKNLFPDKADKLYGSDVNYSELVNDNDRTASQINNQVLVCEMWTRDTIDIESNDEEMPKIYPNGRVIVCCPELNVILSDKENPYKDGKLPFVMIKDYDVPFKFWGEGEVKRLLSAQHNMNELNACIIDNAKATANMPWIIDKNSGIGMNKLTNRPGLVIRKNPQTEVRREQAPNMPVYVSNKILEFKEDIEQISGVYDTVKGNSEKGVYTAQGILSLQEAGQARIRLKVKNLESSLGEIANLWYNRMKQFWKDERWVRYMKPNGKAEFSKVDKESFKYDYDLQIVAGSTMMVNKGAMLDLMIRLAQTPAEDGMPMVDREAVLNYIPQVDANEIMKRLEKMKKEQQQQQLSEQEHMQMHEEGKATDQEIGKIIQELASQVQAINKELSDLGVKLDEEDEAVRMEQLKQQAYNEGYGDAETTIPTGMEMKNEEEDLGIFGADEEVPPAAETGIPAEILNEIQDLSDTELMELLELYPELETQIMQELGNAQQAEFGEMQDEVANDMNPMANNFGTPIPME